MGNLSVFDATMVCEGIEESTEEEEIKAWQLLIDTGVVWELQGWFGRTAAFLIKQGVCCDKIQVIEA